jgi:peptidoglycan/LPS O-acetylase OafA/YrhL
MALGAISYCVYLIHPIVFGMVFAPLKDHRNGGAIAAILALVLTIVIAKLSWEYFEKPLVEFGHKQRYGAPASSRAPH